MNYPERLKKAADRFNSIVCLGLDPVLEEIPVEGKSVREKITFFYEEILNRIIKENITPSAVKPNYAFYAQYGFEGLQALQEVIMLYRSEGFPVILDVKRGDIGKTADAYSRESFDFFSADAVTLSPYMGYDSIEPFMRNYPDGGFYILNKTSNSGSADIQELRAEGEPVYLHVAKKIVQWYQPGIGAVVGATYPGQLEEIARLFSESGREIPLLIPGVGAQGGSALEVAGILKKWGDYRLHRINSSSGINYAYKKYSDLSFDRAAVRALKELNDEINGSIAHD